MIEDDTKRIYQLDTYGVHECFFKLMAFKKN